MEEKPTVFVVDDDPGGLQLPVVAAASGRSSGPRILFRREFLDAYRPGEPGCLVLDVRMPELSGLEVQRELSTRGAGLPIIFITAHSDAATRARAFHGGAFDFLEKPIDDAVLVAHIGRAMVRDAEQRRAGPLATRRA